MRATTGALTVAGGRNRERVLKSSLAHTVAGRKEERTLVEAQRPLPAPIMRYGGKSPSRQRDDAWHEPDKLESSPLGTRVCPRQGCIEDPLPSSEELQA